MLIANIKNELRIQQTMSLFDMSVKLNVEPKVLRDMLSLLIRKGQVRRCMKTPRCGTQCSKCSELITEIYEWVL
jgi:hypothetical protein